MSDFKQIKELPELTTVGNNDKIPVQRESDDITYYAKRSEFVVPATFNFFNNQQIDQSSNSDGKYGTLIGDVNGINTTFTVSAGKYQTGKLKVFLNGVLQELEDEWGETNPSTGVFDFVTAPFAGDVISVCYQSEELTDDNLAVVVGMVIPYAGTSIPTGFLLCDGTAVSRSTYADLFAVISTTYGAGDGSTTFNLPNLRGRVPVGFDSTQTEFDALGETGGAKTHTLTTAEIPAHTHNITEANGTQRVSMRDTGTGSNNIINGGGANFDVNPNDLLIAAAAGGGDAHNNLQPYITLNYIIKT